MVVHWANRILAPFKRDFQLARVEVPPAYRSWFTRATVKHILWLPILCDLLCGLIVFVIIVPSVGVGLSLALLLGGTGLIIVSTVSRRRLGAEGNLRHYRELAKLKQTAIVGGIYWGAVIGFAISRVGPAHAPELMMIAMYLMVLGCVRYTSVPHVGVSYFTSIMIGTCIGLFQLGTSSAVISAIIVTSFSITLYSVIYHLFYNFATRRLQTRTLNETRETVEILLREFDEQGSDWLWEVGTDGRIQNPSQRFHEAAECPSGALSRLNLLDLLLPSVERDALAAKLAHPEPFRRIIVELDVSGERRWWSLSGRPNLNKYGECIGLRGVAADVTQSKLADIKIAYMAHYDALTELPNRALFTETLKHALTSRKADRPLAVLYLDLDRFEAINDAMGHDMGDHVLKITAARVRACIGLQDMAARFGGDEFAVLVPAAPSRDAVIQLSLAIIDALAEPILIGGQQINSGTSIGIAFAEAKHSSSDDLIKYADLALYDAKSRGGHIALTFHPKMYEAMILKRSIEADLGTALLQDELELYYQPLVCIKTNTVVAYEALLRWNHPTHGQIQPSVFIPIAEETGVIVQIGEWVIRNALSEVAKWPDHLSVSVNLSPVQMRSPNIIPTIVNALATTGVAPDRLEIEITESVLMNDSESNLALLHRFKALGLRISLDDFGTGYSSLNYLRSFPFDKIKIDRCFVEDIAERADCQAIIHAVLSLAASLNMTTTAEGIESEAQLALLRADGCDQAQGYLFSRPVRAETLEHKPLVKALETRLRDERTRAA